MTEQARQELAVQVFSIENYHRGLKQCCGVERCFARRRAAQTNHIFLAVRAFVRLESNRVRTGCSWYGSKTAIVRKAIADYLVQPNNSVEINCVSPMLYTDDPLPTADTLDGRFIRVSQLADPARHTRHRG